MKKIIVLLLVLFAFRGITAQTSNKQLKAGNSSSPKINKNKSGIYLTFYSYEYLKDKAEDKYAKLVLLRLNNNYKWNVSVCYFEEPKIKQDRIALHYIIEKVPQYRGKLTTMINGKTEENDELENIPAGFPPFHGCRPFIIKSGSSVLFSVPYEYFIEKTRIKLDYVYPWESIEDSLILKEPQHSIYFYPSGLSKD